MAFQKGQPRPATAGRKAGTPNKVTKSVKDALTEAFELIGGVESLREWAVANRTEFYKLWGKMLPMVAEIGGIGGGPLVTEVVIEHHDSAPEGSPPVEPPAGGS